MDITFIGKHRKNSSILPQTVVLYTKNPKKSTPASSFRQNNHKKSHNRQISADCLMNSPHFRTKHTNRRIYKTGCRRSPPSTKRQSRLSCCTVSGLEGGTGRGFHLYMRSYTPDMEARKTWTAPTITELDPSNVNEGFSSSKAKPSAKPAVLTSDFDFVSNPNHSLLIECFSYASKHARKPKPALRTVQKRLSVSFGRRRMPVFTDFGLLPFCRIHGSIGLRV